MSSYIILQTNLSFVVVPTFKKSICKVQIPTFFRIMSSLHRTHFYYIVLSRTNSK
ncbi:hypothetical protein LEP1GSC029_1123 [Leptospira interrogans str. 2002000626]|uniref:Uncharacterized protein n=2 Tax=Leptospira interrogans TaxID=173 RepID=A0A829D3W4_LEPIR|nr:hypothetical protein LEP1GSC019_2257 [Leptospira interrogans serovar Pyrogenes str. 2006006960]EMM97033.1 hypothetical protein LEP1GSC158_3703 [Leptospira interrogans serovar Zanoni str. LT2156]EMY03645.1 hypothetical protein LEP1GSC029_1123 [Leptospira interrogans str. 2002000626]